MSIHNRGRFYLFRIPNNQFWDSGVGYDYYDFNTNYLNDKNFSDRPSNWFQTTTISNWTTPGLYNNSNLGKYISDLINGYSNFITII